MTTLVTGATGLLGSALLSRLGRAAVLSRKPESLRLPPGVSATCHPWLPTGGPPPEEAFAGVRAVVHLAGEPIAAGRWTGARRERIVASRIAGTTNLVDRLLSLQEPPAVLVSASAVGYYGDRDEEELNEDSAGGTGFLAGLCREWEECALRAGDRGIRVVLARIGLVLAPGGGALPRMVTPFRFGLGGPLGSGRQWWPWIQLDDAISLLELALETEDLAGPLNLTAPEPVRNRDFAAALGRALHRPAILRLPAPLLRLVLGGMSDLLLASQRSRPDRALRRGFAFRHPRLEEALAASLPLGRPSSQPTKG